VPDHGPHIYVVQLFALAPALPGRLDGKYEQ
jgi:hypothetical protein